MQFETKLNKQSPMPTSTKPKCLEGYKHYNVIEIGKYVNPKQVELALESIGLTETTISNNPKIFIKSQFIGNISSEYAMQIIPLYNSMYEVIDGYKTIYSYVCALYIFGHGHAEVCHLDKNLVVEFKAFSRAEKTVKCEDWLVLPAETTTEVEYSEDINAYYDLVNLWQDT